MINLDRRETCVVCGVTFVPSGRANTCSPACRDVRLKRMEDTRREAKWQHDSQPRPECVVAGFDPLPMPAAG